MIGTKASLSYGDTLNVWDLLHGLMLPSGNDAALALSEHFSKVIFQRNNPSFKKYPKKDKL